MPIDAGGRQPMFAWSDRGEAASAGTMLLDPERVTAQPRRISKRRACIQPDGDEWLRRAACAGHADPTLWDVDHSPHTLRSGRCYKCIEALRICEECPVRRQCGERAQRTNDVDTFSGGWALVIDQRRGTTAAVAAPSCDQCQLPILRAQASPYCCTQCAGRGAAARRANEYVCRTMSVGVEIDATTGAASVA
jgi:hypothetical protein